MGVDTKSQVARGRTVRAVETSMAGQRRIPGAETAQSDVTWATRARRNARNGCSRRHPWLCRATTAGDSRNHRWRLAQPPLATRADPVLVLDRFRDRDGGRDPLAVLVAEVALDVVEGPHRVVHLADHDPVAGALLV